jgi:holdfast attachment protein HfaA
LERAAKQKDKAGPGRSFGIAAAAGGLVAALACAGAAEAQSASSTLSAFKAGYGGTGLSGFEQPINVNTRDANGNLVITDGVIQAGTDNSVFSHQMVGGASDSYSGAGAMGSATAIGNNLSVNVSGNYNTVIVNATQTNNGNISATTVLNGKVNLDAGQ